MVASQVKKIVLGPIQEAVSPDSPPATPEVEVSEKGGWQRFLPAGVILSIIVSGVLTGYLLSVKLSKGEIGGGTSLIAPGAEKKGKEIGSTDLETFKDTATGILEKGGIDGEGSHKLIREGGPSQTAYLTSSIIELDSFVGRKVQVWGETFSAQKAGWFMDVGRVKILD